jgi:hypothetical protein
MYRRLIRQFTDVSEENSASFFKYEEKGKQKSGKKQDSKRANTTTETANGNRAQKDYGPHGESVQYVLQLLTVEFANVIVAHCF